MLARSDIISPKSQSNAGIFSKICLVCSSGRKKVKGKEQKLINVETSEFQEKVTQYATWFQDQPMLMKITAVDLTFKEAKYHGVCRVKYQSETKSTLGRKKSLNATFSHSHSLWHKERKAHAEAFNALKIYIEDRIFGEKKELHLLLDINSYYLALWQDTVDTDLKHITSSARKLEAKILKCYPEKYKIEKGKSNLCNSNMQIRDVAFKLRQEIMNAGSIKLPEHLKVEDIFKVEVPDLVQNFFKYLIGGPDSCKWDLESRKRRIKSISQDIVFLTTSGIKKPSKYLQLGLAIKSLTGSQKVVELLNRMGHCVNYSTVEELKLN